MSNEHTTPPENPSLSAVIAGYLEAIDAGAQPDRDALLAAHPELADELRSFFAGQDGLEKAARSLRDAAAPPEPQPGDAIRYFGDYELQGEIARGGMGIVYRARQVSLNRPVALKMILAGQLADDREVRRFRDEAESAANLDHPNIVPI